MKGIPLPGGPATSPIHGPEPSSEGARSLEADQRARELLSDEELSRLLSLKGERPNIERSRQVFVNRNLRMSKIELVGFDMDYTLAIYHLRRIEQLSYDMTLRRLISHHGYPPEITQIHYDHNFVMRGLVVDKAHGNLIKMDRFGHVGRAYHGRRPLPRDIWQRLYRHERIRLKDPRYAWIDTLFALPEACLYAGTIELLESEGRPVDYGKLYDDIREAIDTVHRDGSLKAEIRKDIGHFIFKDAELGSTLHKLRSGGKKLFLLTNSLWDYTNAVMQFMLDGCLPEYPSWRNYFDLVCCGSSKPAFFSEQRPFLELDVSAPEGRVVGEASSLERWKIYQGGNLLDFERMCGFAGETILYVGDHIYGDILKSKKTSLWRTCMVIQELEGEISYTDQRKEEILRLSEVEVIRARLDEEVNHRKVHLNLLERRLEKGDLEVAERQKLEEERRRAKTELDKLRRSLKETTEIADAIEADVEEGFNPFWGLLFKEGNENSQFGEQVEQYACVYTSRVSNLLQYSPMQYFRSPRDLMPHERAGALAGKLSPLGGEGPGGSGKE